MVAKNEYLVSISLCRNCTIWSRLFLIKGLKSLRSFEIFWPLAIELGPFVISNIERFEQNLITNFMLTINVVLYIYNRVFIAVSD